MERNIIHLLNGMRKRGSFKILRPMLHTLKRTSRWANFFFFFWFLCWQICWFYVLLRAWCWDIVILLLFVLIGILNIVWLGWKFLCDHVMLYCWTWKFFFWHGIFLDMEIFWLDFGMSILWTSQWLVGEVLNPWLCVFWKIILVVVSLMMCWFFQVWMYEYFGVGPQVLEDIGDMYPRFLRWLPKYRLSTPPKQSLQVWRMVIDNLTTNDVSFFVLGVLRLVESFFFFLCCVFLCGLASFSFWLWGACWMWMGLRAEWSSRTVWVWPWEILVSWWPGVGSSSTCVPS